MSTTTGTVRERLATTALARNLRQSTALSYERLLAQMGILDKPADIDHQTVMEALWTLDNPNTRRAAVIACRSVLGMTIKIPKAIPRHYDLPDEDTLRMALMFSPYEARGLLMMYAGLRISEACAITYADVQGDRLTVAKQYQELHSTGRPVSLRMAPVKTNEAIIVIPNWLTPIVESLTDNPRPSVVRESLRRGGAKVGIALNPHLLRHWYATTLLDRGVPLALVSKQMRHSDVSVTLRTYAQFNDGDIHRAFG